MPYCGSRTSVKQAPGNKLVSVLRCRAWTCPECQPRRRRRLIRDAVRGRPDTFITLTLEASWALHPEEGVKELSRAWRLIRKRHTRAHPDEKLPFLAVVELTKAGTPHLHILARSSWVDKHWLSSTMKEITGSFIVKIERPKDRQKVGAYCAKYIGQEPTRVGKTKRYWQSQNYKIDPTEPRPEERRPRTFVRPWDRYLDETVTHFEGLGWFARWLDGETAVLWNPHHGSDPPSEWFL